MRLPLAVAVSCIGVVVWQADAARGQQRPRPKYGPDTTPLSRWHEFLRRQEAPDYWRLSPYYAGQVTDEACSLAALVMVLNAARADRDLPAAEELVQQAALVGRLGDRALERAVADGGEGLDLERFVEVARRAIALYDLDQWSVAAQRVGQDAADNIAALRAVLVRNEQSADDLIVANFRQDVLTGDPQGAVGHWAPLAAYDLRTDRVLLLDPDRRWYEPYWVPLERLAAAIATRDETSGRRRGYVVFRRR